MLVMPYVFSFTVSASVRSSGCRGWPSGAGAHHCPGQFIAQEIMDQVIELLPSFATELRTRFTVSDVVTGTAAVFLNHQG